VQRRSKPAGEERLEVFDYLEYRAFLRDYYALMKRTRRSFSFRAFSRRAGLGSPNHLKRVMEGQRNLTLAMANRFADALGLEGDSAEYFVQLVRLGQAKSSVERSRVYERLTAFKAYRGTRTLDHAHASYHSTWYIPAVRELAARDDFQARPEWIAARVLPPIKTSEAKAALRTLLEIGLLKEDASGKVVQAEPLITTGPEMHALHIANYHRMMMQKAVEAIDLVASERRDISAVTILVGEGGMQRIKEKIRRFRRELLELAIAEPKPTQVIQMNFQIFPLSVAPDQEPGR
jgi:uncharacterized protein (TIGR02147 family)